MILLQADGSPCYGVVLLVASAGVISNVCKKSKITDGERVTTCRDFQVLSGSLSVDAANHTHRGHWTVSLTSENYLMHL